MSGVRLFEYKAVGEREGALGYLLNGILSYSLPGIP